MESIFKFALGSQVRCRISGFEGIVVSRTEWLRGCKRYGVMPEARGREYREDSNFYEDGLELVPAPIPAHPRPSVADPATPAPPMSRPMPRAKRKK